jgi:hypothetical protein
VVGDQDPGSPPHHRPAADRSPAPAARGRASRPPTAPGWPTKTSRPTVAVSGAAPHPLGSRPASRVRPANPPRASARPRLPVRDRRRPGGPGAPTPPPAPVRPRRSAGRPGRGGRGEHPGPAGQLAPSTSAEAVSGRGRRYRARAVRTPLGRRRRPSPAGCPTGWRWRPPAGLVGPGGPRHPRRPTPGARAVPAVQQPPPLQDRLGPDLISQPGRVLSGQPIHRRGLPARPGPVSCSNSCSVPWWQPDLLNRGQDARVCSP